MIKVFEDFDLSLVGQMQSVLESNGVRTFLKNQFSSGVLGELPFVEIVPQLFILEESDLDQATLLLKEIGAPSEPEASWVCNNCSEASDGNFDKCWNCGEVRQL